MRVASLLFYLILFWTTVTAQHSTLKVISFNIRYPNPGDAIHYWDNRRPLVVGLLRFHAPDIIGVQEAHRRQLDEIVSDLPGYAWFGVCRTDGSVNPDPDNEFSAILFRKDRFVRLEGNTFWLSEFPDQIGSKGWDAALPRIVTWAKFRDINTDKEFYHFNTHFDHMGLVARKQSADLLVRKIKSIASGSPVVVTGDFNCHEKENTYLALTGEYICTEFEQDHNILTGLDSEDYLKDAMYNTATPHYGPVATFAGNFLTSGLTGPRIDYIFYKNNIEILKHAILSETFNVYSMNQQNEIQTLTGVLASDHLPVFAELKFKD